MESKAGAADSLTQPRDAFQHVARNQQIVRDRRDLLGLSPGSLECLELTLQRATLPLFLERHLERQSRLDGKLGEPAAKSPRAFEGAVHAFIGAAGAVHELDGAIDLITRSPERGERRHDITQNPFHLRTPQQFDALGMVKRKTKPAWPAVGKNAGRFGMVLFQVEQPTAESE
jgi:hypothetical protein